MNRKSTLTVLAVLMLATAPVVADWDPGDGHKMRFPQLPDLNPTGLDANATDLHQLALADDWKCSQTGPVSDIHIWGSFKNDVEPPDSAKPEPGPKPGPKPGPSRDKPSTKVLPAADGGPWM